jgi:putative DNA primase/helicase
MSDILPGKEIEVPPARAVIRLKAGAIHETVTEAEEALIKSGLPVFQRGIYLMVPISIKVTASDGRNTYSPALKRLDNAGLRDHLSQAAEFQKYDGRSRKWLSCPPPADMVEILLSRAGQWNLRQIAGVITAPTIRPDGSILIEPGYDVATRLYHLANPDLDFTELKKMLDHPDRELALECLALLMELLIEFPFKGEVDRAVALSGILSAVARGALPVTPLHSSSAPEAGSGKSYVWDVCAAIAIGSYCPVIAADKKEEETDKRLTGLLLSAITLASIDNVKAPLDSALLCQAVERPRVMVRRLGGSDVFEIENRTMLFASGNNLKMTGDTAARRGLRSELDADMERPETRRFRSNPFNDVLEQRAVFIIAVLTIIRAYLVTGEKLDVTPLQSYGEWSRMVREPLMWLGCADPTRSIEAVRTDDPERTAFLAVLHSWNASFGEDPMSVAAVAEAIKFKPGLLEQPSISDLRDALLAVSGSRSVVDNRALGNWLRAHKDKPIDGYQLVECKEKTRSGTKIWKVIGPEKHEREAPDTTREHMERRDELAAKRRERLRVV